VTEQEMNFPKHPSFGHGMAKWLPVSQDTLGDEAFFVDRNDLRYDSQTHDRSGDAVSVTLRYLYMRLILRFVDDLAFGALVEDVVVELG
jgi:hypothetical protein